MSRLSGVTVSRGAVERSTKSPHDLSRKLVGRRQDFNLFIDMTMMSGLDCPKAHTHINSWVKLARWTSEQVKVVQTLDTAVNLCCHQCTAHSKS